MPFTVPRWAWYALGAVLLVLAFVVALNRYGDAKFDAGKAQADAEWKAASDKLIQKAQAAEGKANEEAAGRAADFALKVEDEKEKIREAQQNGSSTFDVMFGGNGS